jgi:hypothetical protein
VHRLFVDDDAVAAGRAASIVSANPEGVYKMR